MEKSNLLVVEIRVIQREVKNGKEKGKKFFAYQIFNKQKGVFEELRFNKKVTNAPQEEGSYLLEVLRNEVNRLGTNNRKYPLTWISKIESVSPVTSNNLGLDDADDLPF